ncbi:dihydrofolate reductase family protein [Micromonospora sp. WMMD1102]|uniref:dihydrofolate reductase family protein n=1 Tax=Micromonospora sp. WMMD1102 TaxID=3016105 RepID=UPI002414E497|nr:dihydrofolate reductase family protein [Micromonospora sp. WMMD1102]MDG4790490.1 dihydrofolate reductase family protein [Micromonospora sp. WMMD1102]
MASQSRRVVGNILLSLDGRVSGPGGPFDMSWIARHATTQVSRDHVLRVSAAATTALMGRRTYEGFAGFWPAVAADETADPSDREFSRWLNAVEKVVISTTVGAGSWHNTRITADNPATVVTRLRERGSGDIVVLASANIIRALLAAGELDQLSITLCPELIGGGACLFDDTPAGSSWSLTEATPTPSGAICLRYDRRLATSDRARATFIATPSGHDR